MSFSFESLVGVYGGVEVDLNKIKERYGLNLLYSRDDYYFYVTDKGYIIKACSGPFNNPKVAVVSIISNSVHKVKNTDDLYNSLNESVTVNLSVIVEELFNYGDNRFTFTSDINYEYLLNTIDNLDSDLDITTKLYDYVCEVVEKEKDLCKSIDCPSIGDQFFRKDVYQDKSYLDNVLTVIEVYDTYIVLRVENESGTEIIVKLSNLDEVLESALGFKSFDNNTSIMFNAARLQNFKEYYGLTYLFTAKNLCVTFLYYAAPNKAIVIFNEDHYIKNSYKLFKIFTYRNVDIFDTIAVDKFLTTDFNFDVKVTAKEIINNDAFKYNMSDKYSYEFVLENLKDSDRDNNAVNEIVDYITELYNEQVNCCKDIVKPEIEKEVFFKDNDYNDLYKNSKIKDVTVTDVILETSSGQLIRTRLSTFWDEVELK